MRELTFIGPAADPSERDHIDEPRYRESPLARSAVSFEPSRSAVICSRADSRSDFGLYATAGSLNDDWVRRRGATFRRGRCGDSNISRRRTVLIDLDAGQGSGPDGGKRMANGAEREDARRLSVSVLQRLLRLGWPLPAVIDSGNGVQLQFGCDLSAGEEEGAAEVSRLIRRVLAGLAERFDGVHGTAEVDRATYEPARLMRLSGTMNRKGENDVAGGRPWRKTRITAAPPRLENVALERLEAAADDLDPGDDLLSSSRSRAGGEPFRGDGASAGAALERVLSVLDRQACDPRETEPGVWECECPWDCGGVRRIYRNESGPLTTDCFHSGTLRDDPTWAHTADDEPRACSERVWADLRRITIGPGVEWTPVDELEGADGLEDDPEGVTAAVFCFERGDLQQDLGDFDPDREPEPDERDAAPLPSRTSRPTIQTNERQPRDVHADAFKALSESNSPVSLVNFGGVLSRIDRSGGSSAAARPLKKGETLAELARAADWVTLVRGKDSEGRAVVKTKPTKLPPDVVTVVHDAPAEGLPRLEGITATPVLLPGGRLLTAPGFDDSSGLFLDGGAGLGGVDVPDEPTPGEAHAALGVLLEVVEEFPFVSAADRTNFLALLLTPFVRPLIDGPTPLFGIDAVTPRTGKTLLANVWAQNRPGRGAADDDRSSNRGGVGAGGVGGVARSPGGRGV